MLKVMRDSFQHLKWILVFIVALFILLIFVDWAGAGRTGRSGGNALGSAAARVDGDTISFDDTVARSTTPSSASSRCTARRSRRRCARPSGSRGS